MNIHHYLVPCIVLFALICSGCGSARFETFTLHEDTNESRNAKTTKDTGSAKRESAEEDINKIKKAERILVDHKTGDIYYFSKSGELIKFKDKQ
jgi:hypothetical protein